MEYSAPPDPIAGFGGPLRGMGEAGQGKRRKRGRGRGGRGNWRGRKGRASSDRPLRALLCHCLVIVFVKNKIDINHGFQSALALIRQQQRDRKCLSTNDLPSK